MDVSFARVVQLLHVKSDKYVTMQKNSPARQERNAMRVYLDKSGNEGSWFCVEPVYKHVSIGDNVRIAAGCVPDVVLQVMSGERICLIPYSSGTTPTNTSQAKLQLHLSNHRLSDHRSAWEVNCLNEHTEWQINLFLQFDENQPDNVKSVCVRCVVRSASRICREMLSDSSMRTNRPSSPSTRIRRPRRTSSSYA